MNLRGIAPYDEQTGRGTVRHLFTRCAMHTPDAVLCIVSARGFGAQTEELVAYLREHCPELTGIVLDINKQKGNVVLAGDFYTLWGVPELTDRLCGLTFTLSPQAFYQVNPVQAERLYERAVEYAVNAPTDRECWICIAAQGTITPVSGAKGRARHRGRDRAGGNRECAAGMRNETAWKTWSFSARMPALAAAELAQRGVRPDCIVVDPATQGHAARTPSTRWYAMAAAAHRLRLLRPGHARTRREAAHTAAGYTLTQAAEAVDMFPADAAC